MGDKFTVTEQVIARHPDGYDFVAAVPGDEIAYERAVELGLVGKGKGKDEPANLTASIPLADPNLTGDSAHEHQKTINTVRAGDAAAQKAATAGDDPDAARQAAEAEYAAAHPQSIEVPVEQSSDPELRGERGTAEVHVDDPDEAAKRAAEAKRKAEAERRADASKDDVQTAERRTRKTAAAKKAASKAETKNDDKGDESK